MVWLVAAIPAASVVAGIALVVVAIRAGGSDPVADKVRRTAQVQMADLGPDAAARRLRLSAVVRSGGQTVEVLPVDGAFERDMPLTLALLHPADAGLDRSLVLAPAGTGWRIKESLDLSHDWNLRLGPADGRWRLQGRWPAGQQAAYLRPAFGDE
jgi:hypothetical protein